MSLAGSIADQSRSKMLQRSERNSIAEFLASLTDSERKAYLELLKDEQIKSLTWDWGFWARPKQLPPLAIGNVASASGERLRQDKGRSGSARYPGWQRGTVASRSLPSPLVTS